MIEAFASDLALPVFVVGGFLGSLFGGKTSVSTLTVVDVDVLVSPEIDVGVDVDVDVDVDTTPIADVLADLGKEQAALFVTALGGQSQAISQQAAAQAQQAAAIEGFGDDLGAGLAVGARTLALAGLVVVAAFLFFGDGS